MAHLFHLLTPSEIWSVLPFKIHFRIPSHPPMPRQLKPLLCCLRVMASQSPERSHCFCLCATCVHFQQVVRVNLRKPKLENITCCCRALSTGSCTSTLFSHIFALASSCTRHLLFDLCSSLNTPQIFVFGLCTSPSLYLTLSDHYSNAP